MSLQDINPVRVINNSVKNISVYPNPANDFITEKTEEVIEEILVVSSNSAVVMRGANPSFSVKGLPAGLYFLKIRTEKGFQSGSFIKK